MQKIGTKFVSPLLSNISVGYRNSNYIAELVLPIITVKKDTGQLTTYGKDNLRIVESLAAPGSGTNEVTHTVSIADHYKLAKHKLKELVTDEDIEDADLPIQPKIDAVENLTDRLLVEKEKALADVITSSGTITQYTTLSGTDQWSDFANSDPIDDVRTGATTIRQATGKTPNTLIFSKDVYDTIVDHPDIIERLKYSQAVDKMSAANALGRIFGVDRVLVGDAQYNSTKEGITDSLADIWTKDVVLCFIDPTPRKKSVSLGFTYQKKAPRIVDEWYEKDREGWYERVTDKYDQQLVSAACAYLIEAAIA